MSASHIEKMVDPYAAGIDSDATRSVPAMMMPGVRWSIAADLGSIVELVDDPYAAGVVRGAARALAEDESAALENERQLSSWRPVVQAAVTWDFAQHDADPYAAGRALDALHEAVEMLPETMLP